MITNLRYVFDRKRSDEAAFWDARGTEVLALHGPDGRFQKVSGNAASLFGQSPDMLAGRRLMDIVSSDDQRRLLDSLARLSKGRAGGYATLECRLRTNDQEERWAEISLSRVAGGFRSISRNIDARKAREDRLLRESEAQMSLAMRRSDQLANVSHEIRTPLNAVIGFADAIYAEQFGPLSNDSYRDYARIIHDSGQHLLSLITDFLDLSKAEANETAATLAPENVASLVRLCAEIMQLRAAEAGLTLTVDVQDGIGDVMLDAKIVRQILLNLLSNALKFTGEGGITMRARQDGAYLTFAVIDTGIGMNPDELAKVGKRFKQAHTEGVRGTTGTGIGLSLSKALARIHGGELVLSSAEGQGTTAILRLPYELPKNDQPPNEGEQPNPLNVVSFEMRRG